MNFRHVIKHLSRGCDPVTAFNRGKADDEEVRQQIENRLKRKPTGKVTVKNIFEKSKNKA